MTYFKIIFIATFFLVVNPIWAGKFTSGEVRVSLNGFWQFRTDPQQNGEAQHWFSAAYDDKSWNKTEVPGSWENENETSNYIGKAWYRKIFNSPEFSGKRVYLEFDAVSMSYRVFLNNKLVAKELVGNYCERFDITNLVQANNTLAVEVDNSLSWGAYVNWGGIRRPVTLCIIDPVYTVRQEVIANPDLKTGSSKVSVKVVIRNDSETEQTVDCQPTIMFDRAKVTASKARKLTIAASSEISTLFTFNLSKSQTRLWHFDFPNLYTSEIALLDENKLISTYCDRFGIRKFDTKGNKMLLNGEVVRLTGLNWVADDRLTANTLPGWRYKQDIDQMKELGCNFTRLSHRPLPEEVMDYLDEKGMLVISEFNNWSQFMNANSPEPREFARKLIQQQFNHASVIGWSVGNEMGNKAVQPQVNEYIESIIKHIKQHLDSTRMVAYVTNSADAQVDDAAKYGDMIWFNVYWNYDKRMENIAKTYPDKAIFLTEYGGYGIEEGNLIYDTPNNTKYKKLIVDKYADKEYLSGYSIWTYNDYRSRYQSSNPTTATPIHQNRQWGVVDCYRNKKRAFEQIKDFYAPVKGLFVNSTEKENQMTTEIQILPRKILDIPSFTLNGYKLIWEVKSEDGATQQGSFINLPAIKPGDKTLTYPVLWKKNDITSHLKITLLSPTGYNVKDTVVYFAKPKTPELVSVIHACRSVRVVFRKNETCTEYFLRYTVNGQTKTTAKTIDHYMDINNLPLNTPCNISVVGINNAGESMPSKPVTVVAENGFKTLPPVIWGIVPTADGCNIGIGWVFSDTFYEARVTTNPADSTSWKVFTSITHGAFKVNGLEAGKKHFVQVRNATQFAANRSEWSEMLEFAPGAFTENSAGINGIISTGNSHIISMKPAKHASGYNVSYESDGNAETEIINNSETEYYQLRKASGKKVRNIIINTL
jgi:hypothetical protein